MMSVEEFLSSLKQRNLASRTESVIASESDSEPVEIPSELLIAVTCGLLVFPVIGYSKYAATRAGIEAATSDLAQIGYWIRHYHGDTLNWHAATGASVADGVVTLEVHGDHGRMALCQACQDDWDWIDTLRSQASDSTRYLFFRWPAGLMMRRSVMQIGPGLILHGEGSSVPIPPSRSVSGIDHVYLSPQAALAPTPEWLIRVALQGNEAAASFRRESTCDWDASSAA
jgi:hypothetical protein